MAHVQIKCINKSPRNNTHEGITHLGGDGWKWSRDQVIQSIESGANSFYTSVAGRTSSVAVVNGPHGKYLRTHADGFWNDNLLSLVECVY